MKQCFGMEGIMENKNWMQESMEKAQVGRLLETNQYTERYGLILSEEDANLLVAERKEVLKEQRRVEFGNSILPKIIYAFCDSSYIYQDNYVEMMTRLQEIFYSYKNEMLDEITDEELIYFMKEQFEGNCFGDLEYLESTCLAIFGQAIRAGYRGYQRTKGKDEYRQFDEVVRWDKELYLEVLNELCGR